MDQRYEVSSEEEDQLEADGYTPVKVWVKRSENFWSGVLDEAKEIARAEDEADLQIAMDANLAEMIELIEEEERAAGVDAPW